MNLTVSEHFLSIQGEGATMGTPAVFLRLTGCDFECSWCDTIEVWKKGTKYSIEELRKLFEEQGYYKAFERDAHFVITGGNPLLQQKALVEMIPDLTTPVDMWPYIEVETQGSIMPSDAFNLLVSQWNVSPKLGNSGVELKKRLNWDVLKWHAKNPYSYFKFPVQYHSELTSVEAICETAGIPKGHVYLMPICDSRASHQAKAPEIASWCVANGFQFSPRLQLVLWDKTCGV